MFMVEGAVAPHAVDPVTDRDPIIPVCTADEVQVIVMLVVPCPALIVIPVGGVHV
jgi:hypothetical protein